MKTHVSLIASLVCAQALLIQPLRAQEARSGTFKAVQGAVTVGRGQANRTVASGGGVVKADRVRTDATGSAVLMLRDGTTPKGHLAIRVLQGTIRMVTGLLGKVQPENVKVTTPASTVRVRGTDFIVEVL